MDISTDPSVAAHERSLLAIIWVLLPLLTIMIALRFYVRYLRNTTGIDDWVMLCAGIINGAAVGLTVTLVAKGGLRHVTEVPPESLDSVKTILMINENVCLWNVMISKIAVALFLLRLTAGVNVRWRKYVIWSSIIVGITVSIIATFVFLFQCDPIGLLWHTQPNMQNEAACTLHSAAIEIGMAQSATGAVMDFLLALLPITFAFKLNMPLRKKIGICVLLGTGIVAGVFAIMRTTRIPGPITGHDPTYDAYWLALWTFLEIDFVIIAGCVPPAKPFFDMLFFGTPIKPVSSHGVAQPVSGNKQTGSKVRLLPSFDSARSGETRHDSEASDLTSSESDELQMAQPTTMNRTGEV